ncbi:hypothetical protein [Thomasclavelia saccharogumia]|uniref:hypothetical protein n=1 Tax=Thomasclavelia saccharogumia TaxID=341225 RepID=UPI00047EC78C|nr:hypothetical protein [Thomasclavelia saccharogumia]
MVVYFVIMFITALVLLVISIKIYNGNTDLIHSYHQTKVTDKLAYGKAFGKSMFIVSITPLISGIIGLLGDCHMMTIIAVVVLIIGISIGIGFIVATQRKYNKGVF